MDIEKRNNRTAVDYFIISIGYTASTIAPTSLQVIKIGWIADLQLK
jgi:hypothetical protein